MTNDQNEDLRLTPTQFAILDAVLAGQSVYHRRTEPDSTDRRFYGEFSRISPNRAGGAASRAAEKLRDRGLLTERDSVGRGEGQVVYEPWANKLTAKGCDAILAHLQARKFDPTDGRANQALALRQERAIFEADKLERKHRARQADEERHAAAQEKARAAHIAAVRVVLVKHGLAEFSEGLDADQVLAFARDVEGAEYGR